MAPIFFPGRRWLPVLAATTSVVLLNAAGAAAQTRPLRDNPAQHQEWFEHERRFPYAEIPRGKYQEALRQFRFRAASTRGGAAMFALAGGTNGWTAIGPGSIPGLFQASAGRIAALALQPGNNNIVYAAGAQGGVWKTINGGANWVPLSDNECSLAMGALEIDPVNPNIIYAGTGEFTNSASSYYGCGLLRSVDGGVTWAQLGAATFDAVNGGAAFARIVLDSTTAGSTTAAVLYAATTFGLFKSTDAGATWTMQMSGRVSDVVIDRSNPQHLVAAVGNHFGGAGNGVFVTVNGGTTWTPSTSGFPTANVGRIRLAFAPSNGGRVYAAVQNTASATFGSLLGIWRSDDGGLTWTQPGGSGASCASQCWYDMYLMVDPADQEKVFMGGLSLYRSTNGAATFSEVGGSIHVDQHAMAIDRLNPNVIYAGNDGGVYKSVDGGTSWTTLNNDISVTQFYPGISVHPTDPLKAIGGTQDNGTVQYNGSASWANVIGGDGGYTAINHLDASSWWGETQWGPNSGFSGPRRRDSQVGGGFSLKLNGIDVSDRGQFIPPLVMDPVNPRVLYFGTFRLYRTRDNGDSWTPISGDLSGGGTSSANAISAIGIPRADTAMIYAGTADGRLQVSNNYGTSFTLASGTPSRVVKDFAFDPADPQIAWATFSGFGTGHVYRTTNRGVTWTDVSGNLPNIPVNAITYIFPTNELVVGTDVGLYRSSDGGANWSPWVGIPNVAVFDLVYNPNTGQLVAATHGRGMFAYQATAAVALRGDVTGDFRVGALDAQAILYHVVGLTLPGTFRPVPQGDANCDAATTAVDAQVILAYVVGLPVPAGACVGQYR